MARKHELSENELNEVKKLLPKEFMEDYQTIDRFYEEKDLRNETEKALGHTQMVRHQSPSMQMFEQYRSEMESEIEKIANDPALADEQKRAVIRQVAQAKAEEYTDKIKEKMAEYGEKVQEVKDYLSQAVNATEKMSPQEIRQHDFTAREMDAETKTSLMTAFTASQVMAVFNKQADMARHNMAKARFLHKNAYLHMERVHQVAQDNNERQRYITEIQKAVNRLEKHAYTPGQLGIKKMYQNTSAFNRTGMDGVRLIQKYAKQYAK